MIPESPIRWTVRLVAICVIFFLPLNSGQAEDKIERSRGQTLYVPVYSHIYAGDREQPIDLAVTLSIRNIDMKAPISILAVDYYDTDGTLLKHYLSAPSRLGPLASTRYVVKESDKSGGSGANFIVKWTSELPVNPPLVESVMISTRGQLGISFNTRGEVLFQNLSPAGDK